MGDIRLARPCVSCIIEEMASPLVAQLLNRRRLIRSSAYTAHVIVKKILAIAARIIVAAAYSIKIIRRLVRVRRNLAAGGKLEASRKRAAIAV